MGYADVTKLVSDIANAVKRQFGDESGVQITDSDIFRWINQGQIDIIKRQKLLKTSATAAITAGLGNYPVPADVLFVQQLLVNGLPVEYRSFEEANEYILKSDPGRVQTGQPQIWWEWAGTYFFWPVPDSTLSTALITLFYLKEPTNVTALTDSLSVPDTYYNTLLQYCLQQAHEMDEDWTAAQVKGSQYENSLNQDSDDNNRLHIGTYQRITVLLEDM